MTERGRVWQGRAGQAGANLLFLASLGRMDRRMDG
jgi:hypothetical protein